MKYKNSKTKIAGLSFDSKLEASHYLELRLKEKTGQIHSLSLQVEIKLSDKPKGRDRSYRADFVYFDNALGQWVIMDSKGLKVEPYQTKRDWLLDKFSGFVFLEKTNKGEKTYEPYGSIPLNFKTKD